jgi:hypothetical protein
MKNLPTNLDNGEQLFHLHYVHFVIKMCIQLKKLLQLDKNSTNFVLNAVRFVFLSHYSNFIFCSSLAACSTLLNTGNLNEREKKIYCVPCYRRQFGPRGGEDLFNRKTIIY